MITGNSVQSYQHVPVTPISTPLTPAVLRSILDETIAENLSHHEDFHDSCSFTRTTNKLSLERLIELIYAMQSSNLNVQICQFCGFTDECSFANSTLTEARSKLSSSFFKSVFRDVNQKLAVRGALQPGRYPHPVLAIDGSTLHLEPFNKEPDDFLKTKSPNRKRSGTHILASYDVHSKIFTDISIQKLAKKNERAGALEIIQNCEQSTVFVMDRGFHSFDLEQTIAKKGHFFLIRLKKRDFYSLLKIKEEYDIDDNIDLQKKVLFVTKYKTAYKGDCYRHKIQSKERSFMGSKEELECEFRLVKIKANSPLSAEPYEYFITNLPVSEYSFDDIRDLYKARWEIETGFEELKYSTGLIAVHARKMDLVKQEVWARLTLYNLCSVGTNYCEMIRPTPKRPPKRETRLNRKFAFEMFRKFFNYEFNDEEYLIREVWKHTSQVKPNRYFKRHTIHKLDSNQHRVM